jgi:hypothetical protein
MVHWHQVYNTNTAIQQCITIFHSTKEFHLFFILYLYFIAKFKNILLIFICNYGVNLNKMYIKVLVYEEICDLIISVI